MVFNVVIRSEFLDTPIEISRNLMKFDLFDLQKLRPLLATLLEANSSKFLRHGADPKQGCMEERLH